MSGRLAASSRFRVLQHVDPLRRLGIEVTARPPRISKYASVPGRWARRPIVTPAARLALQGAKLATRLPGAARSWHADVTWLEREVLPGHLTLEPLSPSTPALRRGRRHLASVRRARASHSRHRPPGGVRLGGQRFPGRLVRGCRSRRRAGLDGDRHRALHPGLTPRRTLRGGLDRFGCEPSLPAARSLPPWHAFSPRHLMPGSSSWRRPSWSSRGFPITVSISCGGARRWRPASYRDSTSA